MWDADGNRFVDLTAAFGVAAAGHRHPVIEEAIRSQSGALMHAMGDVHPSEVRVELLERLAELGPPGSRVVLGTSGSEAVEIALKTATLYTGRPGWLAFSGAYHGVTYGALSVTDRSLFRGTVPPAAQPERRACALSRRRGPAMPRRLSTRWSGFSRHPKVGSEP